jgi:hypothetical protein
MPDAKVLAGVNVEQAKGTQFGQYVLNQLQTHDAHMQQLVALTGFDPRRDVRELLVASDGVPGGKTGLALAKGNFDAARITAFAIVQGVVTESYSGFTILEEPKKEGGMVFLDATTVAAGDIASVKGAIDRSKTAQPLPAVTAKVNQWSNSQDAWGITTVPPSSLAPAGAVKAGATNPMMNAGQNIQSAAGGVKFGAAVVFSGEAECDTAQNATTLSDVAKMLINIAQMQAGQDPTAAALIKSVSITTHGNVVQVMASLPQDIFQQMLQPHKSGGPRTLRKQ